MPAFMPVGYTKLCGYCVVWRKHIGRIMTQQTLSTAVKPAERSESARLSALLQQERLEPILVVITAAAIAASLLLERAAAPEQLVLILNVISYAAGGVFGLKEGIDSLR